METNAILNPTFTGLSSPEPTALPKNSLEPGKPGSGLPTQNFESLSPNERREVKHNDVDDANRAGLTQMDQPRHKTESSSAAYLEVHSESIRALLGTLTEVRSLRDEFFLDDENSRPGLLLAQVTLILERIERGIPSGREAFIAILRASQLPESVPEATEPTTEMAETTV